MKNIYGTKGTLLANPIREYMVVCANDECDCMEVIHYNRTMAVFEFKKSGWRYRKHGWVCPNCAKRQLLVDISTNHEI